MLIKPVQPKLLDEKQTTIYKRAVDKSYHLKMKASRFIYSEINQKFPIMPFTARYVLLYYFLATFSSMRFTIGSTFFSDNNEQDGCVTGLWKRSALDLAL